ncbi:MAG: hypothetical protein RXR03_07050 [Thermocladium sp.]
MDTKEGMFLSKLIENVVNTKATQCAAANYATITDRAVTRFKKLFPDAAGRLDELLAFIRKIQPEVAAIVGDPKLTPAEKASKYIDGPLTEWVQVGVDAGVYATLSALQAMEAVAMCGEDAAAYFLMRGFMGGSLYSNLLLILLKHLDMEPSYAITLLKTFLGK